MIPQEDMWALLGPDPWPKLPPRSALVHLKPLGLGTPDRESLSSFYMRLADIHGVAPPTLARMIVFPEREADPAQRIRHHDDSWRHPYFNGIGFSCMRWVSRLEELTGLKELGFLTLGFLGDRLSTLGLACENPRWCPECFREDTKTGIAYGRLLWSMAPVTCCPKHGTKLVDRCDCVPDDACESGSVKSLPNICARCGHDLGSMPRRESESPAPRELSRARLVADLLMSDLALGNNIPWRGVADLLSDAITRDSGGNAAGYGRLLGVGKSTLHGWVHGMHVPNFSQIIQVAEAHGCSIADVLCGRSEMATLSPMVPKSQRGKADRAGERKKVAWDAIATGLKEILESDPPISMRDASKRLGLAGKTLRRKYPGLCSSIAARWLESRAAMASQRRSQCAEEARDVARSLAEKGIRPTWNRIKAEGVHADRLFRGRVLLRDICEDVRREFGLDG